MSTMDDDTSIEAMILKMAFEEMLKLQGMDAEDIRVDTVPDSVTGRTTEGGYAVRVIVKNRAGNESVIFIDPTSLLKGSEDLPDEGNVEVISDPDPEFLERAISSHGKEPDN